MYPKSSIYVSFFKVIFQVCLKYRIFSTVCRQRVSYGILMIHQSSVLVDHITILRNRWPVTSLFQKAALKQEPHDVIRAPVSYMRSHRCPVITFHVALIQHVINAITEDWNTKKCIMSKTWRENNENNTLSVYLAKT